MAREAKQKLKSKKTLSELVSIRLSKEVLKEIDKKADKYTFLNRKKFTRSDIIHKAIDEWLRNHKDL